ncbi:hypothetical protein AVEN_61938-1 [Araneus ventricosus]|uniref:Uncharacterized protein n=1 Tax=Araneus ventricosus TaxID=182803 RepID=A0A4Y2UHX0_ARAVE|nr:hypothetical protein AVEN_61938-1 [Araneus ventricosus]
MARGFVGWLQHSGETSDRNIKGSGQFLQAVVIAYASWVGIRPPAVRITTAINLQRFIYFRKAYYRETFLSLPHFLGGQIVFCLRWPTCHRASWQSHQSATAERRCRVKSPWQTGKS